MAGGCLPQIWVALVLFLWLCLAMVMVTVADQQTCGARIEFGETGDFSLLCKTSERIPGVLTTVFLCNGEAVFGCLVSADKSGYLVVVAWTVNTPIWAANRDLPIPDNAGLTLDRAQGALLLRRPDAGGAVIWAVRDVGGAAAFWLRSDGNLLLLDSAGSPLWESFSEPTDLLVPGQSLRPPSSLLAGFSSHISATASFSAVMHPGGLVLYENSTSSPLPYLAFAYPWIPSTAIAVLIHASACNHSLLNLTLASLSLVQSPMSPSCLPPSSSPSVVDFGSNVSFVRLDPDGVLRAYYPDHRLSYNLFLNITNGLCRVPNACGPYGICSESGCRCPDNASVASDFVPSNSSKFLLTTVKCAPNVPIHCSGQAGAHRFLQVRSVDYFANDHILPTLQNGTFEDCEEACARSCACKAAFYRNGSQQCFLHEEVLSMISVADEGYVAAIKLQEEAKGVERRSETKLIVGITVGTVLSVALFAVWFYRKEKKGMMHGFPFGKDEDELLQSLPGQPRRFSFKELQAATWEFSQKLGVGGFGSVYRGVFPDGSSVAVKQLENVTASSQGLKEFRNEVVTLSNINHQNLVHLRGFCAERAHRLLVYEYVSNGSLDAWLFLKGPARPGPHLDWKRRLSIATHTARGLYFLHDQCRNSIIHLDIKPQNILLDENFMPKISDFGLSRLVHEDHNTAFTRMRGTPGYMAPECLIMTNASEKSDVYSFGMVLLEIVSGRKNVDVSRLVLHGDSESWYFPAYAAEKFKEGEEKIGEIVDANLGRMSEAEMAEARRVIKIAFWCIQDQPPVRPTMYKVLHMLEGHSEVRTPPLHSFSFGMKFHLNNTIASSAPQTPLHHHNNVNSSTRSMDSPSPPPPPPPPASAADDDAAAAFKSSSARSRHSAISPLSSLHASPSILSPWHSPIHELSPSPRLQHGSPAGLGHSFPRDSRSPASTTPTRAAGRSPASHDNTTTTTTASSRFAPLNMVD